MRRSMVMAGLHRCVPSRQNNNDNTYTMIMKFIFCSSDAIATRNKAIRLEFS